MTLVNFRRAICRLQLRRRCIAHGATSGFSARSHLNCNVNFAGPFSLIHRPRGRPRSETLEKENRPFLVQLSAFLPSRAKRCIARFFHFFLLSTIVPSTIPPLSATRTYSTEAHTHHRFRIFSRFAGINIYSPVDGVPPHEGILRAKDEDGGSVCRSVSGRMLHSCTRMYTHAHTYYRADGALHLFHARWFAMPSAGACPRIPIAVVVYDPYP